MPPSQVFHDGEEIVFSDKIIAARFGPSNPSTITNPASKELVDVTAGIHELISNGRVRFVGGIHTALKFDPCPGRPKVLFIWSASQPSGTWPDFATVRFDSSSVVAAKYARATDVSSLNVEEYKDMTAEVRKLLQSGRSSVEGGIHTALGDPFPGTPKLFLVWHC